MTALRVRRAFKKFILSDGRKVVLREADSKDLEKLLAYINSLVREKKRDETSQLFTGFQSRLTRRLRHRTRNGEGSFGRRKEARSENRGCRVSLHKQGHDPVYEKAGCKRVGRIRGKVYGNGRFIDSLIMARRP